MKATLSRLAKSLKETFFPAHLTCELCKRDVFCGELICKDCEARVHFNDDAVCDRCGRPDENRPSACASCADSYDLDKARSVFCYVDGGETLVKMLKYSSAKYLAETLASWMKNVYYKNYFSPDVICFVPMTVKKEYARGYNQAELLARELARLVSVPCKDLLEKVKETPHQAGLDYKERLKNQKGAYALRRGTEVKGKKVLLVDDVLTTGATAGEIASLLKRRGAKSVYLITLASVRQNNSNNIEHTLQQEELWDL